MNFGIKPIRIRRAQISLCAALMCLAGSAYADETHIPYNLPQDVTKIITVPQSNTPVQLTCNQNQAGNVGAGQVTIVRSIADGYLHWVGFDFYEGAFSRGYGSSLGVHIIYCDYNGAVAIEVVNGTQIQIKNYGSTTQSGVIMFVY